MYKCEILADSLNPQGDRITTFRLTYPRIIHAELMTHRMFSRNSASSRAIPFKKMVEMVEENPFTPIAWQKDHKGMQGNEYITDKENIQTCIEDWLVARNSAIESAKTLNKGFNKKDEQGNWIQTEEIDSTDKVTKQLCNRLLEPFMWHTVLVTATEWENFFELRCPKYQTPVSKTVEPQRSWEDLLDVHSNPINEKLITDNKDNWTFKMQHSLSTADIHIQAIAEMMWDAYNESTPKKLKAGEWHIPFGDNMDINLLKDEVVKHWNRTDKNRVLAHASRHEYVREEEIKYYQIRQKIATARCARISYETLGDNPKIDYEADIKLHDKLLLDKHLSCFEHCARAMSEEEYQNFRKGYTTASFMGETRGWCNNFRGFIQYRYLIENNIQL